MNFRSLGRAASISHAARGPAPACCAASAEGDGDLPPLLQFKFPAA